MKAVVGLGNPGSEYEKTRHNAGFEVIDRLGTELGASFRRKTSFFGADYEYARVPFGRGEEIVLVKPLTYMNRSGEAVKAVLDWFKIELSDLVVVHDDVSLPLGKIRIQQKGGAGGNHGIESIIEHLWDKRDFDRVKVGVGPDPGGDARSRFVLSPVAEADRELYEQSLKLAREAVSCLLKRGAVFTANKYNGKNLAEPEPEPRKKREPKEPSGDSVTNAGACPEPDPDQDVTTGGNTA